MTNPTVTDAEKLPVPLDAINNLINHQEQLDMDGCMVAVSRQALDEVLAFVNNNECYSTAIKNAEDVEGIINAAYDVIEHIDTNIRCQPSGFGKYEVPWQAMTNLIIALNKHRKGGL